MKSTIFLSLFVFFINPLSGQLITGKIIDSLTGEPLEYVSIGVVNTFWGTITDSNGDFKIDVSGQSTKAIIRISMISYTSQTFSIEELMLKEPIIKLVQTPVQLKEVIVKPSGKPRNIGITSYTRNGHWCGWGGSKFGKGHEIGTKIELGDLPVQIKSFHFHLQRQAFDSCLVRLHIRSIKDTIPSDEQLNTNIILSINKESGWIDFDLSKYNLVLKGNVAITLEWVKVFGINTNRAIQINKKITTEYVLFNTKNRKGITYIRWGSEAKWIIEKDGSPSFYVSVR